MAIFNSFSYVYQRLDHFQRVFQLCASNLAGSATGHLPGSTGSSDLNKLRIGVWRHTVAGGVFSESPGENGGNNIPPKLIGVSTIRLMQDFGKPSTVNVGPQIWRWLDPMVDNPLVAQIVQLSYPMVWQISYTPIAQWSYKGMSAKLVLIKNIVLIKLVLIWCWCSWMCIFLVLISIGFENRQHQSTKM